MISFGISNVVFSYLTAKSPSKGILARNILFLVVFVMDMTNYVCLLLYIPNVKNSWIVYFFFVGFGATEGILQSLTNSNFKITHFTILVIKFWPCFSEICRIFSWKSRYCIFYLEFNNTDWIVVPVCMEFSIMCMAKNLHQYRCIGVFDDLFRYDIFLYVKSEVYHH